MKHVLELEVNGKFLTLFPDAKIKMIRKSPLFLNEADPGSRIYSFTIPAEPNAAILDYANLLFSNKKIATVDCNVWLKGVFYKKAKLDITGFTKETFEIRVRFDKPYFVEAADRKLRSFEYKKPTEYRYTPPQYLNYIYSFAYVNTPPTTDFTVQLDFDSPTKDFTNQIINFEYHVASPETITEFITRIAKWFIDNFKEYGVICLVNSLNELCFLTPFNSDVTSAVLITFTLDATALLQFVPPVQVGTFSYYQEWDTSRLHAKDTIANSSNYDYVFFPVLAENGSDNANYNPIVNNYNPTAGIENFIGDHSPSTWKYYNGLIPFPYLYSVFDFIHKELGIIVEDQFFDEELKTLVYYNNTAFSCNYTIDGFINAPGCIHFKYGDIIPDITYKEFIKDIQNMFCLVFDFESNNEKLRLIPRKAILQNSKCFDATANLVYNYIGKPEPKIYSLSYTWDGDESLANTRIRDKAYLIERDTIDIKANLPTAAISRKKDLVKAYKDNYFYYLLTSRFSVGDWLFYMEGLDNYSPIGDSENIATGLSTLFMEVTEKSISLDGTKRIKWLLPDTGSKLNLFDSENASFSQRLLFYRGLVACDILTYDAEGTVITSTASGSYPFGSYHNYDFKGNKVGNYSLAWNAPDGLVEVWWKLWLDFINNTYPVTLQFDFSASQFMEIDLLEKLQVGNQQYLIDEMEVELSGEISLVTVKCYPYKTSD